MTERPIILFGGKGGVGKTTCSAAVAACSAARGLRTMVVTSDMTPSLSDIFDVPIGDKVREISKNLSAVEISQESIVARWKERFSRDFYDILSQLIDVDALDTESRHHLLDYIGSAPSLREETMLDLVVELVEKGGYERVVWDTAPSGETLNLLDMPRFIRRHLRAGAKVFEGLDKISKQLIGRRSISDTMDEWVMLSERITRFIQERTAFYIVANPEALVVKHVERLMKTLAAYSVRVEGLVVNRVIGDQGGDALSALRLAQEPYLAELTRLAAGLHTCNVPLSPREIRGREALRSFGGILCKQLGLE